MSKDTSGSVFPTTHNGSTLPSMTGLTKREYFAGLAMQTIPTMTAYNMKPNESFEKYTARIAFAMADAMLAEGNKQ